MSFKLYELTDYLQQVQDLLEQGEDVQDTLEAIEMAFEEKVEGIVKVIRNFEARAEAKKNEAKRLREQAEVDLNHAQRLKEYLRYELQKVGKQKVQTDLFTVSIRKGRESIEVDENLLPADYWRIERKPFSKTELKKLIQEGKEIPGVQIVRGEDTISIR